MLESVGKFDVAQEHKENLAKVKHVKECLFQLIHMDIEKPAQKMRDQAKLLGYSSSTIDKIELHFPMKRSSAI